MRRMIHIPALTEYLSLQELAEATAKFSNLTFSINEFAKSLKRCASIIPDVCKSFNLVIKNYKDIR